MRHQILGLFALGEHLVLELAIPQVEARATPREGLGPGGQAEEERGQRHWEGVLLVDRVELGRREGARRILRSGMHALLAAACDWIHYAQALP